MKRFRVAPLSSRAAVLVSGGLDSAVLLGEMVRGRRAVFPIYLRAGHRWERAELSALRRFIDALDEKSIKPLTLLDLPFDAPADHWSIGGSVPGYRAARWSNYIPGRNLSLLSKAAVFCATNRIGEIAIALLKGNPFPDARPDFFRAFERSVRIGLELPLRISTPFLRLNKAQVIQRGAQFPLELTLSCANPARGIHCGRCTKCAERIEGFRDAGVADPARYARARK